MRKFMSDSTLCLGIVALSSAVALGQESIQDSRQAVEAIDSLLRNPTAVGSWETRKELLLWVRRTPGVCLEKLSDPARCGGAAIYIPMCEELLGPSARSDGKSDVELLLDAALGALGFALQDPSQAANREKIFVVGLRAAMGSYIVRRDTGQRRPDRMYEWLVALDDAEMEKYVREVMPKCSDKPTLD